MNKMKNIAFEEVISLASMVDIQQGQVVSRTISQGEHVSFTLFAFDRDEEIGSHDSEGDAMVTILEGKAKITIGEQDYELSKGQTIVMPANIPHALYAIEPFKMQLLVIFEP